MSNLAFGKVREVNAPCVDSYEWGTVYTSSSAHLPLHYTQCTRLTAHKQYQSLIQSQTLPVFYYYLA